MKLILAILLLLPSCQAVRDYRMAKAINDNIDQTDAWFAIYSTKSTK